MADHGPAKGFTRWLYTTNHKDIGTMYLIFSLIMFFIGGSMALVIRSELLTPGLQFVHPEFFNQMTTMHALIMILATYRGQCAELCGKDHGYMPVVVEVLEPDAFATWVGARTGSNE